MRKLLSANADVVPTESEHSQLFFKKLTMNLIKMPEIRTLYLALTSLRPIYMNEGELSATIPNF
jgi:hypothetical protein